LLKCKAIPLAIDPAQYRRSEPKSRIHANEGRRGTFVCSLCRQAFEFEVGLRSHLNAGYCIAKKKYPNHFNTRYVATRKLKLRARPPSEKPDIPRLAQCPSCRAKVKPNRLEKHLRRVHGATGTTSGTQASAPKLETPRRLCGTQPGSQNIRSALPAEYTNKDVFDQTVGIDRRDRTRNIGYVARENGRYGSHPLHDGFDDEAGPE
jgi:hypothetical protein